MSTPTACDRVAAYRLLIVQGQDGDGLLLPLLDALGAPLSAAGWSGIAQVRYAAGGQLVGNLRVTCDATGVLVWWTAVDTLAWEVVGPQPPVWDVVVTDLTGNAHVIAHGPVSWCPRVSRA